MAAVRAIVRQAEWGRVREFTAPDRTSPAVLAITGEAGAGKSTSWRSGVAAAREAGHLVLRTEPSASETDMSFAGLSDLLAGVLPEVSAGIPAPQLEGLEVALLLRAAGAEPPTAHAVGLAALATLRACASRQPVLLAIDDVQWLDDASMETLTFAFRRMTGDKVSLLIAARTAASPDPLTAGEPSPPQGWRSLLTALSDSAVIDLAPLDISQVRHYFLIASPPPRRGSSLRSPGATRSGPGQSWRAWTPVSRQCHRSPEACPGACRARSAQQPRRRSR